MRGLLVRALELRARRFSDPADRLQFLRKRAGKHLGANSRARTARQIAVLTIMMAAVIGPAVWVWHSTRHMTIAVAKNYGLTKPGEPAALVGPRVSDKRMNDVAATVGPVWLVQSTAQFDLYSNGLRVEDQYAVSTASRRYIAFARNQPDRMESAGEWRTEPAGIVYHSTESHLAPFEEDQNQSLRRAGEGLLDYVNRRRAYHFVIDRFGRVFRVVRESDYANHAGNSVWADERWIYMSLNQSFFGVAFEASSKAGTGEPINNAQIHSGRILTEMLRARYQISPANCVSHAQVSISPVNHAVGYHRDWAANLPFWQLGLANNYKLPPASVTLFGYESDPELDGAGPSSMAEGLQWAAEQISKDAAAQNLPVERYRERLQKRYRDAIRAMREKGAYQEYN